MKTLFSQVALEQRIKAMAEQMNTNYADCERLILIGVLKGSFMFLSDLCKHLTMPCQIEMVRLSSYDGGTKTTGKIKAVDLSLPSLHDADVVVVEDIVDTGLTMKFFLDYIEALHRPKSLKLAVLLDKPVARLPELAERVRAHYIGFTIGDEFVIGYGLDYDGLYRNLPYIGVMEASDLGA
jgi:hypoxanthine phosphoribosyltransferase